MSDVTCNLDVLKDDAENVWEDASEKLLAMKASIPTISTFSFSLPFGAAELSELYANWSEAIGSYISGGSDEFLRFEKVLLLSAIEYGKAHGMSLEEIKALESEIDI